MIYMLKFKKKLYLIIIFEILFMFKEKVYGDWGLGIGDWAQSPIPNPQSP